MVKNYKKVENFLSSQRVAETLEISHETVNRWLREGILKGTKVGKQWRVRESELLRFLSIQPEAHKHD
jgi:excisionase family DNA binding protein